MKNFGPHGMPLDADFRSHADLCECCRAFDTSKPITATELCLEGSILWKRDNEQAKQKVVVNEFHEGDFIGGGHRVSRDKAKQAMRYKS